jgi:hypothetical protein
MIKASLALGFGVPEYELSDVSLTIPTAPELIFRSLIQGCADVRIICAITCSRRHFRSVSLDMFPSQFSAIQHDSSPNKVILAARR